MKNVGGLEMKIEKTFVFSDIHYPEYDTKAISVAEQVLQDFKPDRIIYIGDFLDCTPVSHWLENKKQTMENKRLLKDYEGFKNMARRHIKLGKNVKEIVFMEGNHEDWVNQYIDKHPEMQGLIEVKEKVVKELSKEYPKIKMPWVEYNKFYNVGKLFFTHGIYTNKYHAEKHLNVIKKNIMYGHTHTVQETTDSGIVDGDKHSSKSIGCLCSMSPSYMRNKPNQWVHAFALVYTDIHSGNFTDYVVKVINGKAVWNNKVYNGGK
ncbi:MAG TPA: metallophosphoesterase [Allocoleopsis sp.]